MKMAGKWWIAAVLVALLLAAAGCNEDDGGVTEPLPDNTPQGDLYVTADEAGSVAPLAAAVAQAQPGFVIVVGPGTYAGTLVVDKPVRIISSTGKNFTLLGASADTNAVEVRITGTFGAADSLVLEGLGLVDSRRGLLVESSTVPVALRRCDVLDNGNTGIQVGSVAGKAPGDPRLVLWQTFLRRNGLAPLPGSSELQRAAIWSTTTLQANSVFFEGNAVDVALSDGAVADLSRVTAAESRLASLWLEGGSRMDLDGISADVPTSLRGGLGWAARVDGSRLALRNYEVFSFETGGFRVTNGTLVLQDVQASSLRGYGIWSTDSTDSLTATTFSVMPRYLADNTAGYGVYAESTGGEHVFWASESLISGAYRSGIKAVGAGQRVLGADLVVQENGAGYVAGEYTTPLDPVRGGGVSLADGAVAELDGGELFANEAVEGGGLAVLDAASSATLAGVLVRSNSATGVGGGLYIQSGQVDFSGANLESNRALSGGGVAVLASGTLTMAGGDIVGGQAVAAGGGAYISQASATFTDGVDFRSCTVPPTSTTGPPGRGGGIYVSEAALVLEGSTFTNCAAKRGAAFYATNLSQDLAVSDCTFVSNTSSGNSALYALDLTRTLRLERCVFADNEISVPDLTAASSIYSRQDLPGGRVILSACTVAGNRNGGAAIYQRSGEMEIHESVVAFNRPGGLAGRDLGFVEMSCNDFFSNSGLDYGAGADPGPGSFSADPLFCDQDNLTFTVDAASPLLPANNDCGVQIGALGQGCSSNP